MTESACDNLDLYLDGGLSQRARVEFVTHLSECALCRKAVRLDEHVMQLLGSAKVELGVVPSSLTSQIEQEPRNSARRRSLMTLAAMAAAIMLILASGVWIALSWIELNRRGGDVANGIVEPPTLGKDANSQAADQASDDIAPQSPLARLSFHQEADAIVIPIPSDDPTVSIFWLYPTANPHLPSNVPGGGNQGVIQRRN
jgi:hypothetical protein